MESKNLEVDGSDDFPFHRGDFQLPAVSFGAGYRCKKGTKTVYQNLLNKVVVEPH